MVRDRRGVEGVPLKLMLVALILSLSTPVVISTMERYQGSIGDALLAAEGERLAAAVAEVYSAGEGNIRKVALDLPVDGRDAHLEVGGNGTSAMAIRCCSEGRLVRTIYLTEPPIRMLTSDGSLLSLGPGKVDVVLEAVLTDGKLVVTVGV